MRNAWTSGCCDTCRRRKVKCDRTHPICLRCSMSQFTCERRYKEGQLVHVPPRQSAVFPTPWGCDVRTRQRLLVKAQALPKMLSQGSLFQAQLLSFFLREFIPSQSRRNLQTFSYFENLPNYNGTSAYISLSCVALSLVYLGQIHGDKNLLHWSLREYHSLLRKVRKGIAENPTEDVIVGVAILSMYEVYNPLQESSWSIHVRTACNLVATRGPETPIDPRLLCFIRTLGFYESIGRRQTIFPQNLRWDEIISEHEPFDQLLSIVLTLPRLEWLCDKVEQTTSAGRLFIAQFIDTYSQLRLWYLEFLESQKFCSFEIRAATPGELSFVADFPELKDTFPDVIVFSDRYVCQLLLLCWTGFFVMHYEASKFMRRLNTTIKYTKASLPSWSPRHKSPFLDHESALTEWPDSSGQEVYAAISRAERCSEVFAERICQAMVYADKHTNASAMKLILINPLWMLQQYFLSKMDQRRSLWCQCALQAIPPRKVGFSSLLTKLSISQYQALGDSKLSRPPAVT